MEKSEGEPVPSTSASEMNTEEEIEETNETNWISNEMMKEVLRKLQMEPEPEPPELEPTPSTSKKGKKKKRHMRAIFFKGHDFLDISFLESDTKTKKNKWKKTIFKNFCSVVDDVDDLPKIERAKEAPTNKVEESDGSSSNDEEEETLREPEFVVLLRKNAPFATLQYGTTGNKQQTDTKWHENPQTRCNSILQEIGIFHATFKYNSRLLQFRINKLQEEFDNRNNEVGSFLEKLCNEVQLLQTQLQV